MSPQPSEPPPSPWVFPNPAQCGPDDVVAIGADLAPGTLLAAYRIGLFPMYLPDGGPLAWWCPQRRGVIPVDGLRVTRSLRRSVRRYRSTVDQAFEDVIDGCADPSRPHGWITDDIRTAYLTLHRLGWAHSIETWDEDRLVGGLYGVAIGGLFAGESMFHRAPDASKVALVRLARIMDGVPAALIDVQWVTDHLASLGAVEIGRLDYLDRLARALDSPLPAELLAR